MHTHRALRAVVCLLAATLASQPTHAQPMWYRPPRKVSWQYQLSDNGTIATVPGAQLIIFDLDTATTQMAAVRTTMPGVAVVCYISFGTWEKWRAAADAARGIAAADWTGLLGNKVAGWPGEKWLDVRAPALRTIMAKRIAAAKTAGCDAIDPDNVDGYQARTGFPLVAADQVAYNRWIADAAHAAGLGVGLKNCLGLLSQLQASFDFFVNESCFAFNECGLYDAITDRAVLGAQYCDAPKAQDPKCYCPRANAKGWNFLVKDQYLGPGRRTCGEVCAAGGCASATATTKCPLTATNYCPATGVVV